MRIILHIGPEETSAHRVQSVLAKRRDALLDQGVLFARSPGNKNHTRLFMAVTDAQNIDPLRFNRGYITEDSQNELHRSVAADLAAEVAEHRPDTLILSAAQLGAGLRTTDELARLRAILTPLSEDVRVVAHVDHPCRMLARAYGAQILEGLSLIHI